MADQILKARGTARYPWLNKPDTKFQPEGVFKVDLEITAEEASKLLPVLEGLREKAKADFQKSAKGKKAKDADLPLFPQLDSAGEETGSFILRAKMKASGISKKTGKPWSRTVPIFDAKGKPASPQIYGGSEIIVAFKADGWANPKGECGATCYLEGVQVLKLAGGSGGSSAGAFGFGSEEGYSAEDDVVTFEATDEAAAEGGYDFD